MPNNRAILSGTKRPNRKALMTPQHLRSLFARFLTAKSAGNRSPRTITWYEQEISHFLLWLESQAFEDGEFPALIDGYLAAERKRGVSPATVSARFRALSAWLNWCARRKLLEESPIAHVERPRVPKRQADHVSVAECSRLMASITGADWLDARDRLVLLLLFYSGLRVGELTALTVADIDAKAARVIVRQGKGMKARLVPVHANVPKELLGYLYSRPRYTGPELLLSSDGYTGIRGPLTTEGVRQMLKRRCKLAGVRYLHPHAWRHGFAMWTLNAGVGMSGVSALMGHSNTTVTESVYAHWQIGALEREYQEALARLGSQNG